MKTLARRAALFAAPALVLACDQGPGLKIPGNARFVNGATSLTDAAGGPVHAAGATLAGVQPDNWIISPNRVKVRILSIAFERINHDNPSTTEFTDCEVTYDRSAPSLSTRLDCPFSVDTGTYVSVALRQDSSFKLLIDDPVNHWFSDPSSPTLFSLTRPAAGAGEIELNLQNGGGTSLYFNTPLVVMDSTPSITLTVVMGGLHTVSLTRTDGVPAFFSSNKVPVFLFPSLSGIGSAEFYSSTGTANNTSVGNLSGSDPYPLSFVVFYDVDGAAALYFVIGLGGNNPCAPGNPPGGKGGVSNTSPKVSPQGSGGNKAGGYLGLDASGTLAWALGKNADYSLYHSIWSMPRATAPGQTVPLKCFATETAPEPLSGLTYASGAPPILNPSRSYSMRFVAK